jgi:hypothetical protein
MALCNAGQELLIHQVHVTEITAYASTVKNHLGDRNTPAHSTFYNLRESLSPELRFLENPTIQKSSLSQSSAPVNTLLGQPIIQRLTRHMENRNKIR